MRPADTSLPGDIAHTKAVLCEARPYAKAVVAFYADLFSVQVKGVAKIRNPPFSLPRERVDGALANGLPLVAKEGIAIDFEGSGAIFEEVLAVCRQAEAGVGRSARRLGRYMEKCALAFPVLGSSWLGAKGAAVMPPEAEMDPVHVDFLIYHALKPALAEFAGQLAATCLGGASADARGTCPVCGEPPAFALLAAGGARSLVCGFCQHAWPAARIFCPFCGNRDPATQQYFSIEGERGIRADICEACGRYIKTVDLRELGPGMYPPLLVVAAIPLEIKLQERETRQGGGANPGSAPGFAFPAG